MPNINDVYKSQGARNRNQYLAKLKTERTANSAITVLTDSSGGTPSNTIADVPASYTEATLANQIASLTAKINALINAAKS